MNTLKRLWDRLRTSFWFSPMLILITSIALAIGLIAVDSSGSARWLARWPRVFGAGADGARAILSTVAGSMMTIVGVTFSMTLVTLALASGQYTSRILRNFMRDRVTQVVLGIFTGIFVYCLIVLRTIRSGDERPFIPGLAVSFSLVLATAGIVILIYFIHHIASSIQASSIVASVADETIESVDRLYPEHRTDPDDEPGQPPPLATPARGWQPVTASCNGYIEAVDVAALLRFAVEHDTIVRLEVIVGGFVVDGEPLLSLAVDEPPSQRIVAALRATVGIGRHRTLLQDCAFGVRQIVDIALRALSPGTNDTTTAVMCVDYLTAILVKVASRRLPLSLRDDAGVQRVMLKGPTFESLVSTAFAQIRESAGGNVAIMLRLLGAFHTIADATDSVRRRRTLGRHVDAVAELAGRTVESPSDRARFDERLAQVRAFVNSPSTHRPAPTEVPATGGG